VIVAGALRIDPARRQAQLGDRTIELTPHEFDVLALLAAHPGIVFTREMLLQRVWTNDTHVTERSVDTLVKRLRQKIEIETRDPKLTLTVWGTGFKFADACHRLVPDPLLALRRGLRRPARGPARPPGLRLSLDDRAHDRALPRPVRRPTRRLHRRRSVHGD